MPGERFHLRAGFKQGAEPAATCMQKSRVSLRIHPHFRTGLVIKFFAEDVP